jgi:hypothetical protein
VTAHVAWGALVGCGLCAGALVQAWTNVALPALLGLMACSWVLLMLAVLKMFDMGKRGECPNCGCGVPDEAVMCWNCEEPLCR